MQPYRSGGAGGAPARAAGKIDLLESALALLILCGIVWVYSYFLKRGYLPQPFFDDVSDTYMDWYNTAHWVYVPGTATYRVWGSVYPAISFVFLWFFSNSKCYLDGGGTARDCDHLGMFVLAGFIVLNIVLSYRIFRKINPKTAGPRAFAVGLGMPMLYAWERGNLIIPCYTLFILGHGRLLKSAWLRSLCVAASINFKPYLIVTLIGAVLKRYWRRAEGYAIALVAVYLGCYAIYGKGSPAELLQNLFGYYYSPPAASLTSIAFSPTYNDLLKLINGPFPVMQFIGSRPLELLLTWIPRALQLGLLGVLACFAGVAWRPNSVPAHRLTALTVALLLTVSQPGGYAPIFLFFLVFLEPMKGIPLTVAIVCAYIISVPYDYQIVHVLHQLKYSYLSGQTVGYDMGILAGSLVRPALLVVIEYALVAQSLIDVFRAPARLRNSNPKPVTSGGRTADSSRSVGPGISDQMGNA